MSTFISGIKSLFFNAGGFPNPTEPSPKKEGIEVLPTFAKEEGFSSTNYLGLAFSIGSIAAGIFPAYRRASLGLMASAAWYLSSAAIIKANEAAEGTSIEKPIHQLHALAMEVKTSWVDAATLPDSGASYMTIMDTIEEKW